MRRHPGHLPDQDRHRRRNHRLGARSTRPPTVVKAVVEAPLSHQIANGLANILEGEDPMAIEVCMARMWEEANYYGRTGSRLARDGRCQPGAVGHQRKSARSAGLPAARRTPRKEIPSPTARFCSAITPEQTYELARKHADQGFTAIKFGWGPMGQSEANDIELVRQARRGAGEKVDVLIDAGQVWDWKTALKRAEQFAEFRPFWIEEPLNPDDVEGLPDAERGQPHPQSPPARPNPVSTASNACWSTAGSTGSSRIRVDAVSRPWSRSAAWQLVTTRRFVNHSFKSGITIAASLHGLAAAPGGEVFEYCMAESPLRHELTKETFPVEDGFVSLPDGPGLGVTVDEQVIETYLIP